MYAGKPGRLKRKTAPSSGEVLPPSSQCSVIKDWHHCVKHLSVSSKESMAHRLVDGSEGYWQSSGSQGKVCALSSVALHCGCQVRAEFLPSAASPSICLFSRQP